MAEKVR